LNFSHKIFAAKTKPATIKPGIIANETARSLDLFNFGLLLLLAIGLVFNSGGP